MFQIVRDIVCSVLKKYNNQDYDSKLITIDRPKNSSLGDIYTNAAMVFSKKLGIDLRHLAEDIARELNKNNYMSEVAGPGFINIRLPNKYWQSIINEIITKKNNYSITNIKNNEKINIEFVSANPTGPLHTGHGRNAVFGSVVAKLLEKICYKVTREFYINDQGNQIKNLARSVYIRYKELLGKNISNDIFTSDMYCGSYVRDLAKEVIGEFGTKFLDEDEVIWLKPLCKFSIDIMMKNIKNDLKDLGVFMDCYTSEAELCNRDLVNDALKILTQHDDIYEGVLPKPKGVSNDEWEERSQVLFKSTKYGDDIDRAIKKSDGTWTYFAGDLAYHLDKIQRGFKNMINVLGADHNGYVKRLKAAVHALSGNKAKLEVILYQLINFLENGVPIRMSKRTGNFITLRDVIDRVGKDVTRFMMISRHHDVMIDFDFTKAVEFSMDNPLFYIQYAHARICSVFRYFTELFGTLNDEELNKIDKMSLNDESELNLIKTLTFWPENVKSSALAMEPHRIPIYLKEIATNFHSLWNKGKNQDNLRFIDKTDKTKTIAKMSLLRATQIVIADGLEILGITPLQEMK